MDTQSADGKFWLIWSANNHQRPYQHWSEAEAIEEARRLATIYPAEAFVVLEAKHAFRGIMPPEPVVEEVSLSEALDGRYSNDA